MLRPVKPTALTHRHPLNASREKRRNEEYESQPCSPEGHEAKVDHLLGQGQVWKDFLKNHREHVAIDTLIMHFHDQSKGIAFRFLSHPPRAGSSNSPLCNLRFKVLPPY
jgi:hypothetical protein